MPSTIINPQTNETLAPWQFDGGVTIGGANISGGTSVLSPSNVGLKAWDFPLVLAGGTGAVLTAAYLYVAQMNLGANVAFSNVYVNVITAASAPSTTASFAGLYYVNTSSTAALVASTAQIGTTLGTTTGFKTFPLTTPFTTASSGSYYVGLVVAGTTLPVLSVAAAATAITTDATVAAGPVVTASGYPFAINGTSVTTLPTTLTLSSNQLATAQVFWTGMA